MSDLWQPVLEDLVDALPLGLLAFDDRGDIRFANRRALELLELDSPEGSVQELLDLDPSAESLHRTLDGICVEELAVSHPELRIVAIEPTPSRDDIVGRYVAMLGHELRNPLAPLRLAAKHLRRDDVDQDQVCDVIDRQVAHLSRIVDDLLDTARLAHGRLALDTERIPVMDAVSTAVESARERLDASGHTLHTDLEGIEGVELDADLVRLSQALTNLLANAAQYTPPGGTIGLRGWVEDGSVLLQVVDDGEGIESQALESIFDTFVQRNRTMAAPSAGLGLGLGLARRIVRRHGGTLRAHSEGLGKGSCFTLELPGAFGPSERPTPSTQTAPMPDSVLIVDDNEDASAMLALVLESQGANCTVVDTGTAALEAMATTAFDVAVIDIGLPDIDGFEVARRATASPNRPARVVALSGYGQQKDRTAASEAGFDAYYVKPLAADAIGDLLG